MEHSSRLSRRKPDVCSIDIHHWSKEPAYGVEMGLMWLVGLWWVESVPEPGMPARLATCEIP